MILSKPSRNEISYTDIAKVAARVAERLRGAEFGVRDTLIKLGDSTRAIRAFVSERAVRDAENLRRSSSVSRNAQHAAKDDGRSDSRRAYGAPIRSQFFLSDWRWPLMKWAIPIAVLWCLAEVWTGTDGARVVGISVFGLVLVAGWLMAVRARESSPARALAIVDSLYVTSALLLLSAICVLLITAQWGAAQALTRDLLIWAPLIAGFASFTYARTPSVAVGFTIVTYATLIVAVHALSIHVGAAWQHVSVQSLMAQGAATLLAGVFFSRFRDSVSLTIAKLRVAESHSFQDTLTGLSNRRKFDADWKDHPARGVESSLILLDIDHFKSINDRFGHPVGDQVLLEMAQRICRATDGVGTAYRWGGEEFAVIVPGAGLQARRIARCIVDAAASEPFEHVGRVTLSAGTASVCGGETSEAAFQRADSALLRAKTQGRNRVCSASRTGKPAFAFPADTTDASLYVNRKPSGSARAPIQLCYAA